jgi:ketosteroid isomerase-like protein
MKSVLSTLLLVGAAAGWAWADAPTAAATAPSAADASKAAEARQFEQDWTDALIAGDIDKVSQNIADDWRSFWVDGSINTKASVLAGLRSGRYKVISMELRDVNVKVVGDVAIVQGIDIEKSTFDGKDSSGKYVWTDVLAKREGKWVAVRGQAVLVK